MLQESMLLSAGNAHLKLIALFGILGALLVTAGAGYLFLKGSQSKAPMFQAKTFDPNCSQNDPELCKFLNNWKTQSEYVIEASVRDESGEESSVTIERSGERLLVRAVQGDQTLLSFVAVGDAVYTKDQTDGGWWKQPSDQNTRIHADYEIPEDGSIRRVGSEACGDLTCLGYEATQGSGARVTFWFDQDRYLLRRMTVASSSQQTAEATVVYRSVSIPEPTPAKEPPPGRLVIPGVGAL